MDARSFLGLEATADPCRFRMPVAPHLVTAGGFLFGGAGLAAAVVALEEATGRPLVWATAQYLSYARPSSVLEVDVTPAVRGRQVTQARAVASADGAEVVSVAAALGRRPHDASGAWAQRPDVPPPEDCPPRPRFPLPTAGTIMECLELRLAAGRLLEDLDGPSADGRCALWARVPELGDETSAASLAVLADFVPFGIGQALGRPAGGNSLDNTLRVACLVPAEWVLLDVRVQAVAGGFGHGLVHLWAGDVLLATASQSAIVRFFDPPAPDRSPRDEPRDDEVR